MTVHKLHRILIPTYSQRMGRPPRRVSHRSPYASFARHVSPPVLAVIRQAEAAGVRGEAERGLSVVRAALLGLAPEADDDRIALAEIAALMRGWGASDEQTDLFLDEAAAAAQGPRARGAILLAQARRLYGRTSSAQLSRALSEFSAAGDLLGQAVTLGRMAFPADDGIEPDYRLELGRRGLELAIEVGEPWAVAWCSGLLAACETYFGAPDALDHWQKTTALLPANLDNLTAEFTAVNHVNWAMAAIGSGDYASAWRALRQGRLFVRGSWVHVYSAVEGLLRLRTGALDEAAAAGDAALACPPPRRALGALVLAAVALEKAPRLSSLELPEQVRVVLDDDFQFGVVGAATLALTRHARREPGAWRGLLDVLQHARATRLRFGWEDAMLALAECNRRAAQMQLTLLEELWPGHARGVAVLSVVRGKLAGRAGYAALVDGADALAALPEPITAGRAFYAAAKVAPTPGDAIRCRDRAVELLQSAGADRSLAMVVRDRSIGGRRPLPIPGSQRHNVNPGLTPREREVAQLAAQAYTAAEIAERLGISVGTARNHILHVREKFGSAPKRRLAALFGPAPEK